jgi:hypothetical protein
LWKGKNNSQLDNQSIALTSDISFQLTPKAEFPYNALQVTIGIQLEHVPCLRTPWTMICSPLQCFWNSNSLSFIRSLDTRRYMLFSLLQLDTTLFSTFISSSMLQKYFITWRALITKSDALSFWKHGFQLTQPPQPPSYLIWSTLNTFINFCILFGTYLNMTL